MQVKVEFEKSLRRVSVPEKPTLEALTESIRSLLQLERGSFDVKYRDEDNDLITLGSDSELDLLVNESKATDKVVRLLVEPKSSPAEQPTSAPAAEQDERDAPEIPFAEAARLLSDPQVVENILLVFSSPLVVESLTNAAKAYVESKGDCEVPIQLVLAQIPLVWELLKERIPEELKQAFAAAMERFTASCAAPFFRPDMFLGPMMMHANGASRGACGSRREGRCGPNRHAARPVHFGVFCDGCSMDAKLKVASMHAGHTGGRGMIRGEQRWKSQSLDDFDLCQTCKESGKYTDEAFGPFVLVEPRARGFSGGLRRCHRSVPVAMPVTKQEESKPVSTSPPDQEAACTKAESPGKQSVPDEWVPVPSEDPFTKWAAQLETLQSLGFNRAETYLDFLEEEQGNLTAVINRIVRRDL